MRTRIVDKKKVDLRITESTLEIYHKGERLTTHNLFPECVKFSYQLSLHRFLTSILHFQLFNR